MVTQNALSFLGYESFMMAGKLKSNNNTEAHNFNVVKKNGKYYIIDTVNRIYNKHIETMDNKETEELTSIGEYSTILKNGETITYYLENPILNREQTLSNETQLKIQQAIENLQKEYTILIIAHRLSTVRNADRILMLSEGKIIAEGNHSKLLKECKQYRDLYENEIIKEV